MNDFEKRNFRAPGLLSGLTYVETCFDVATSIRVLDQIESAISLLCSNPGLGHVRADITQGSLLVGGALADSQLLRYILNVRRAEREPVEPEGKRARMLSCFLLSSPIVVTAVLTLMFGAWVFVESGYHFYFAKGMTVAQVVERYGEPERRSRGVHDGADYLQYYTGFLNFVDLRVQNGNVTDIEIRPDD